MDRKSLSRKLDKAASFHYLLGQVVLGRLSPLTLATVNQTLLLRKQFVDRKAIIEFNATTIDPALHYYLQMTTVSISIVKVAAESPKSRISCTFDRKCKFIGTEDMGIRNGYRITGVSHRSAES
jgi:hypothetical protein